MKILYTKHAEIKFKVLERHGCLITKRDIENAIESPDSIEKGRKDRLIAQKLLGKKHLLRVIYEKEDDVIKIITFYPARRRRYED